jgi:hypothetical protein
MLADIEVNATVYVQPTSRSVVHCSHRTRDYGYPVLSVCKQHTVADWRTAEPRCVCHSGSVRVVVCFLGCWSKPGKSQLDERRDHGPSEMSSPVVREYVADFLLQVLQAHGFACKACDEIARRLCPRAKTQAAQQVEQLFEHLPPHRSQRIRWPHRSVADAAPLSIL